MIVQVEHGCGQNPKCGKCLRGFGNSCGRTGLCAGTWRLGFERCSWIPEDQERIQSLAESDLSGRKSVCVFSRHPCSHVPRKVAPKARGPELRTPGAAGVTRRASSPARAPSPGGASPEALKGLGLTSRGLPSS